MFKKKYDQKQGPLWKSFIYAFEGIRAGLCAERNMMIHFFIMLLVIGSGIFFKISISEWLICLLLFGLVIALELMNTAVETTINICMPDIDKRAKLAKDTAAGSVLVAAIIAAIIGLIIFIPYIVSYFG